MSERPKDRATGMKSSYELALERLDREGIERPREEGLDEALREQIAQVRRQAEAKLAELEILYEDRRRKGDAQDEEDYLRERRRIEQARDRKLDKLRGQA